MLMDEMLFRLQADHYFSIDQLDRCIESISFPLPIKQLLLHLHSFNGDGGIRVEAVIASDANDRSF